MKIQTKHSIHFVKSAHSTNNSDTLGIAGRRLNELAFFKLPIMPSVIIDHYITQTIGEESLATLLQANLRAFATDIGKEYGENDSPMLLNLRPSPNLHYVDCPTLSYVGLTGKNVRAIQKTIGRDDGRAILFVLLDSLFSIISKIEELETDKNKKDELTTKISKMEMFVKKREKFTDAFDVIKMYAEVFPRDFFEDVKVQLDIALRLMIRLSILQEEEMGIVVEPIFYASDESFCFGSCFTRNITTGGKILEGEVFKNTVYPCKDKPQKIETLPKEYLKKLEEVARIIEEKKQKIYRIIFVINNKKLYLLDVSVEEQVSEKAKIIFLLELYNKKVIKAEQLIKSIDATSLSEFYWETMELPSFHDKKGNKKDSKKTSSNSSQKEELEPKQIIDIANSFIKISQVQSNAECIEDVKKALFMGSGGIGLFKTEKMLLSKEKINLLRGVVFAKNVERAQSLHRELTTTQANEFYEIFKILQDAPITIRLLNISINDVLPVYDSEVDEFLKFMNKYDISIDADNFDKELCVLREDNQEFGMRGSRIWMDYPNIYETQIRAIFEAIYRLKKEGINANVAIAIPLINYAEQMRDIIFGNQLEHSSYNGISAIEEDVRKTFNVEKVPYRVGAIIESPAGALKADKIARYADFFIFDAVALTEKSFAISRENPRWISYLTPYRTNEASTDIKRGFSIDESVQELINASLIRASMIRPNATFTLFVDHTYGRKNMEFFMEMQGNYLSCPIDDIPLVIFEIAQAEIEKTERRLEERRLKR